MRKLLIKDIEIIEVTEESVEGRIFTNSKGETVCLGMTKKVEDILGLPISIFEDFQKQEIFYLRVEKNYLLSELIKYRAMSFWQKIGLIFGIKPTYKRQDNG